MSKQLTKLPRLRGCRHCHNKELSMWRDYDYPADNACLKSCTVIYCDTCHCSSRSAVMVYERFNRKTRKQLRYQEYLLVAQWNRTNIGGGWLSSKQLIATLGWI